MEKMEKNATSLFLNLFTSAIFFKNIKNEDVSQQKVDLKTDKMDKMSTFPSSSILDRVASKVADVVDKVFAPFEIFNPILFAYSRFVEYASDRITKRFPVVQKLLDKADDCIGTSPSTGNLYFAKGKAKIWAKKVGASAEAEKEYANKIYTWHESLQDYMKGTRNENKKQYPHINLDGTKFAENAAQTTKRLSIAHIRKNLNQYRTPSSDEIHKFAQQQRERLGLNAAIYRQAR